MTAFRDLRGVATQMRDGVRLRSDVYLPATPGPHPAVLMRTPYGRQRPLVLEQARRFAAGGFAYVVQDVRGRHDSDGDWVPHVNEGRDGYDTIEWLAAQPWCNGRVGTIGASYGGWVQWAAAREHPPHLLAMSATASAGAWMEEVPYHDGALWLTMFQWLHLVSDRVMQQNAGVDWARAMRTLPLRAMDRAVGRDMPEWHHWLDHGRLDAHWARMRLDEDFRHIDLPVLHVTGWHDLDQPGALYFHRGMVRDSPAAGRQRLVIGPWDHGGARVPKRMTGGVDFGPAAVIDHDALQLAWFDRWLKDAAPAEPVSGCRYFVTGANAWTEAAAWPPAPAAHPMFLGSDGGANTFLGDGRLEPQAPGTVGVDRYVYDPADPVIALFDFDVYGPSPVETPLDRRFVDRRPDVLVYTSAPAGTARTFAGSPRVRLFVESDAADTDWFATLSVVDETGRAPQLAAGRLRARFARDLAEETLLAPNQAHEVEIKLTATAFRLLPGQRLRLSITSSMFPIFARNLNTGGDPSEEAVPVVARNTVHHGGARASVLLLPAIDGESA